MVYNINKISSLFNTPREVENFKELADNKSKIASISDGVRISGVAIIIILAAVCFLCKFPYKLILIPVGIWVVYEILQFVSSGSGKKKGIEELKNYPLVAGGLVQWNSDLFEEEGEGFGPAIVLYSMEKEHIINPTLIMDAINKIRAIGKNGPKTESEKHIYKRLEKTKDVFNSEPLSKEITGYDKLSWQVKLLNQESFPKQFNPETDVFPAFLDKSLNNKLLILQDKEWN
jgi:hypothetical protein